MKTSKWFFATCGFLLPSFAHASIFSDAVGVVKTFPFANKKQFISCTVFHIGDGWMVTSGHCFLGMQTCLQATVDFAPNKPASPDFALRGKCLFVARSLADDAEYAGPHEDYTLFKSDFVPLKKLDFDLKNNVTTGAEITSLSFPRPRSGLYTEILNNHCVVVKSIATSAQGAMLSPLTFAHNCGSAGGSQGAPIVSVATGKVIGIHQGHAVVNVKHAVSETSLNGLNFAKQIAGSKLLADVQAVKRGATPKNLSSVTVGAFNVFAFPEAVFSGISADVMTLGQTDSEHSNQVSFRVVTGSETSAIIVDGNKKTYTISGTQDESQLQQWSLPAPVKISITTSGTDDSVYLRIRDIQQ